MAHEPTTVNVWAPELFYDEPNEQFIICWASTIPGRFPDHAEPHDNNQRMYYTTTRDFKTFAPAKLFFDPGFSVIDCTIVKDARPLRARAQGKLAADAGPPRRVRRLAARSVARRLEAVHRQLHRRPDGAQDRRRLADLLRCLPRRHLRRRQNARLQDRSPTSPRSLVSRRATNTAPRSPCRARTSTTCSKSARSKCPAFASRWSRNSPPKKSPKRLAAIDEVAGRGPFQPNWESLGHFQTPRLVPRREVRHLHPLGRRTPCPASAANGIRARCIRQDTPEFEHHLATYGPQSKFGYKDFIPQFKAEKFDATEWAKLFKEAGAKYVIPVAEHHDGFPMYDSDLTDWSRRQSRARSAT